MQVCCVYAGKDRDDRNLADICRNFAKGLESQGHNVDIVNINTDPDTKLSFYDYIIVGTVAKTAFGGSIPESLVKYLARAGLRSQKTLSLLMKAMEGEGMYLKYSEVIKKPDAALALGKRLNVERNL